MTVLGIETATTVCAAAVVSGGKIVAEESLEQRNVHAEKLLSLVDAALHGAGCALDDVGGIAVSIGPGSFTGLRIGLSVAKGLAYATGKPLVAVPTLLALAHRAAGEAAARRARFILAVLDARRDEVYYQLFRVEEGSVLAEAEPRDATLAAVLQVLATPGVMVTGEGRTKVLEGMTPNGHVLVAADAYARCGAGAVACIGEVRLLQGEAHDPIALEPRYIKDFFLTSPH